MPLLEVLKGEEPPTPEMILYFSGAAAAAVVRLRREVARPPLGTW